MIAIEETDISTAWAKAFLNIMPPGVKEISPLIVSVNIKDDPILEREDIRSFLDKSIETLKLSGDKRFMKLNTVNTVANTIFPNSLWNPKDDNDAELLYERFEKAWPRIKKCKQNRRGSYFQRMVAYRSKLSSNKPINQLKQIVEFYKGGNRRRSAFQASVFDPTIDLINSKRLGFPCLHQISFAPIGKDGLAVTGYYATQFIFDRAYGNYLGLCRLGKFIASQLDLKLVKMTCIASIALRGTPSKKELSILNENLTLLISAKGSCHNV